MRADRLISLLMLLQTNGRMTADALAKRLEVSPRTIYRDLDALSSAGVPVYAERGPNGGCMLMESYRTNLTGLNEKEVQALFMFTVPGLLADLGADKASEAAMLKLMASLPAPFQQDAAFVQERLHLDPAAWFQPDENAPFLPLVQTAVWQNRRLRLNYRRGDGQWVKRLIDPYGLVAKASIWYVVGGLHSGKVQVYRVSRIMDATLTGTSFQRPESFDLVTFWQRWRDQFEAEQNRLEVRLRVPPTSGPLLALVFGEGIVQALQTAPTDTSGHATLSLTFDSLEGACRQLLGLGTAVEVVTPQTLREQMLARAKQVAEQYKIAEQPS
ncbi:helix-turn-helix transcriptional regulator [Candidatus Leptofilum sp.]|uniref:helix-turn-helix transcriptional regulator n=1 Tax=Candidatus Leptofilum sp. TaxID=3241576 RepID=UPI003B5B48D6